MSYRISWMFVCLFAVLPVGAQAQQPGSKGVCTEDNLGARQQLESVLTDPTITDVLEDAGLTAPNPADVRVLQHPADNRICAQLRRKVPRPYDIHGRRAAWTPTYFRLGDRYIITVVLNPDIDLSQPLPAWGQTIILDLKYNVMQTILN